MKEGWRDRGGTGGDGDDEEDDLEPSDPVMTRDEVGRVSHPPLRNARHDSYLRGDPRGARSLVGELVLFVVGAEHDARAMLVRCADELGGRSAGAV